MSEKPNHISHELHRESRELRFDIDRFGPMYPTKMNRPGATADMPVDGDIVLAMQPDRYNGQHADGETTILLVRYPDGSFATAGLTRHEKGFEVKLGKLLPPDTKIYYGRLGDGETETEQEILGAAALMGVEGRRFGAGVSRIHGSIEVTGEGELVLNDGGIHPSNGEYHSSNNGTAVMTAEIMDKPDVEPELIETAKDIGEEVAEATTVDNVVSDPELTPGSTTVGTSTEEEQWWLNEVPPPKTNPEETPHDKASRLLETVGNAPQVPTAELTPAVASKMLDALNAAPSHPETVHAPEQKSHVAAAEVLASFANEQAEDPREFVDMGETINALKSEIAGKINELNTYIDRYSDARRRLIDDTRGGRIDTNVLRGDIHDMHDSLQQMQRIVHGFQEKVYHAQSKVDGAQNAVNPGDNTALNSMRTHIDLLPVSLQGLQRNIMGYDQLVLQMEAARSAALLPTLELLLTDNEGNEVSQLEVIQRFVLENR